MTVGKSQRGGSRELISWELREGKGTIGVAAHGGGNSLSLRNFLKSPKGGGKLKRRDEKNKR